MNKAVEVALKYVGQKEVAGNMGFVDKDFEAKMKAVGFEFSHAWCSYSMELVFKEAYPERFKEFDKLFSASAVKTFENFRDAGYLIGYVPRVGHLVVWQKYVDGKPTWQGHIGLVTAEKSTWEFSSAEGNTSEKGSREGTTFLIQPDRKVLKEVTNGLKVIGFIQI